MSKIFRGAATRRSASVTRGAVALTALSAGLIWLPTAPAMAGGGSSGGVAASNNLVIQKVDAATGALLPGAQFTGNNCERPSGDLDWSCEDLGDYAWFRDNLPEFGTTPISGGVQAELPIVDSFDEGGQPSSLASTRETITVGEVSAPAGYNAIADPATVYRSGRIWKADNLPAGVTLVESNNYYYLRFADTRQTPVLPTAHTTTTATKVTTTTPVTVQTGSTCTDPSTTFQVDSYRPTTAAQAAVVKHLAADAKLAWREDRALWGHSTYEFVTLKSSEIKAAGSLAAAINAKTHTVPNLGGRIAVGATWTTAWALTGTASALEG